ncbi:MAG: ATP-binding protein [Thiotrichaceae bacterium]|nr:ATP-binding protein [Thiotrichaceae bacterium]
MNNNEHDEEELLKVEILNYRKTNQVAKTKLLTDDKVLARVTDGIYRQPGSALRELISNAYDADANNVVIDTDAPRFESMTIRDDGNGMSIDVFVNLINHIGGSAKRNKKGLDLNITSSEDSTLSPKKKRKLIGKIGIGLFSVAQLTREFEIITKREGDDYYLKAIVRLNNYSDESMPVSEERGEGFETGSVEIWTENTENIEAHGTDIILRNIKKSAKDILKSIDTWGQSFAETDPDSLDELDNLNTAKLDTPSFHIGCISGESGYEFYDYDVNHKPNLPWLTSDDKSEKFSKLYQSVLDLTKTTINPKLSINLDNYLHMLWILSLSVPLDYVDKHPFELTKRQISNCYLISNMAKGQATSLPEDDIDKPFNNYIPFKSDSKPVGFNVVIDGVQLFRPLRFTGLPTSKAIIKDPIMFFGSYAPRFSTDDSHETGGNLEFDAYILWSPKVIPRDHNGVLVRLHNASGIMFDETFMKHQVAEHTIKSQLSIEVFISKGLDSALNIDRESFNISHPHYQILMRWLHQALRQVINKYKSLKNSALASKSYEKEKVNESLLDSIIDASLVHRGLEPLEKKFLVISGDEDNSDFENAYCVTKEILSESIGGRPSSSVRGKEVKLKSQAILQVLDSYGLLDGLSQSKQDALFSDIVKVIGFKGD